MKETQILVEQQPPQGFFICDHAGLVINKSSRQRGCGVHLANVLLDEGVLGDVLEGAQPEAAPLRLERQRENWR